MEQMTIGQVANEAGVQASTLRYYESIGLLPPAKRVGGKRRYTAEALDRLGVIQLAKKAGFTLSEIETLLSGFSETDPPSARWKMMAQKKIEEVEALINRAQGMKRLLVEGLECECLRFDECVVLVNGGGREASEIGKETGDAWKPNHSLERTGNAATKARDNDYPGS